MDIVPQKDHEYFGRVIYDKDDKPVCHLCGRSFDRLMLHVNQIHELNERQYKFMFGLNLTKGIISDRSRKKLRKHVEKHFDTVLNTLLTTGEETRFEKGHEGRTKEKMSEQTRLRIVKMNQTKP